MVAASNYGYDAYGRLETLEHVKGETTLAEYSWTFDAGNRISEMTFDWMDGDPCTVTYAHDARDQLTGADYSDSQLDDESYDYDENGNRKTANGQTYATDQYNRTTSNGTYTYDYDTEGNRTRRYVDNGEDPDTDITEYVWDHRNRLVTVSHYAVAGESADQIVTYTYDALDRRIGKEIDEGGEGDLDREERYVYDGQHIALRFVDPDGEGEDYWLELSNRYLHGPVVDQILADEQYGPDDDPAGEEGQVYWPLADHLGSVRDLAEFNGGATTIAKHIVYDSFGRIVEETDPTVEHHFGFTGRERDPETGHWYYRARYYDAAIGKFLSEDPIGFDAGDANLYRYVENGPTMATDPDGLDKDYVDDNAPWFRFGVVPLKEIYYVNARFLKWGSYDPRVFVGYEDPTGVVYRARADVDVSKVVFYGSKGLEEDCYKHLERYCYSLSRAKVDSEVLGWGSTTDDWDAWFKEHDDPITKYHTVSREKSLRGMWASKEWYNLKTRTFQAIATETKGYVYTLPLQVLGVKISRTGPVTLPRGTTVGRMRPTAAVRHAGLGAKSGAAALPKTLRPPTKTLRAPSKVPNPYGRVGSPAHRAKVQEVFQDIKSRGLRPQREAPIPTVNGQKATRYMDVVARDANGRIVEVHQVGKTLKSKPKVPVARERAALRDVRYSPELRGAKRYFHEY